MLSDKDKLLMRRRREFLSDNLRKLDNVPSEDELKTIAKEKKQYQETPQSDACRYCSCKDICLKA